MRRSLAALFAATALLSASPALAAAKTYTVTVDKHTPNEASFTSKAAIVKFTGRTAKVSGSASIDPNAVAKSSGTVTVDLASLDTGIELRNEHMRATLETEKFPTASFKFTSIQVPGNKLKANTIVSGTAVGTFTLHGVTKPFTAPIDLSLLPDAGQYRPGEWIQFSASFKLKVTDYGITMPAGVFGVKVAEVQEINIDGMAKAN